MIELRMPALGADMEAGTVIEWRVAPGDTVRRGDVVALVDTDKAQIEIESWQAGVVEELVVEPGRKVPVGTVIALLRGEAAAAAPPEGRAAPAGASAAVPALPVVPPSAVPPRPAAPAGKPAGARAAGPPAPAAEPAATPRVRATPLARRLAAERGVDLARIRGTGAAGSVTGADVEAAASAPGVVPAAAAPAEGAAPAGADRLAAMRRRIGTAMERSKREIPHYYLQADVDLARALAWLEAENLRRPVEARLLPAALLVWAAARAARAVPEVNGHFTGGAFRPSEAVHLGVIVSLRGGGILAPTLRDADRMDPGAAMDALRGAVERARSGTLRSSDVAEATLTVTNLGDLGVEAVFGVIHPPQVAIVGFGRIAPRPVAADGLLGIHPVVTATLSADHRASDGQRGARFLAELSRVLQEDLPR